MTAAECIEGLDLPAEAAAIVLARVEIAIAKARGARHRKVIGFSGTREGRDPAIITKDIIALEVKHGPENLLLVQGGARGVDSQVRQIALERHLSYAEFPANWARFGPAAGPLRNIDMAEITRFDGLCAYPGRASKGTWHMVETCRDMEIPTLVREP